MRFQFELTTKGAGANTCSAKRGFRLIPTTALPNLAIPVRSDWKGHGLGHLLMAGLIQLARERASRHYLSTLIPAAAERLEEPARIQPQPRSRDP